MVERVRGSGRGATCLSERHGDLAVPTVPGLTICADCRECAEEDLLELPVLYEMCAYVLDARHPRPRERVSGGRPGGIVLRDAVVGIRSDILGVLASWCGLVTNERGVPSPDELSIPRLSTFVLIHFSWLTAHPAGPDFADELAALTERARGVLKPEPRAEMDLGPCTRDGCGSTVRAEGHPPTRIRCDAGHEWPPEKWLLLREGQRLDSSREGGE
jgi:hypothetical protein